MVDTAPQAPPVSAAPAPAGAPAPAPAGGPPLGGAPSTTQILQEQRDPQRASLLDGLRGLRPGGEAAAAPAAGQPPAAAAGGHQASAPSPAPGTSPAAAAPSPEQPAAAPAPAEVPKAETPPDEHTEHPGMVQVRKAEQHMRAKLADERAQMQADFDRQRTVWQQQIAELDKYKAVMGNARHDPLALLAAAGFGDADYEPLAQLAYAMSPEGSKDPRVAQGRKIAAHESLARRAQQTEQEKLRTEVQALRDEQARRDAQAAAEHNVQRYLHTVTGAVGETSPHVRYAMARAPEATQQRLLAVADRLYQESGPSNDLRDVPAPEAVLKAFERERATHIRDVLAELEALGVDPRAFGKPAAAAAAAAPAAAPPVQPATGGAAAATAAPPVAAVPVASSPPPVSPPAQPPNEDEKRRLALEELRKLRFAG